MRDPRLTEIEFLSLLSNQPSWSGTVSTVDPKTEMFDLPVIAFKQLLFELIADGSVGGATHYGRGVTSRRDNDPSAISTSEMLEDRDRILDTLWLETRQIAVVLTHRGRLRLWRLKDEIQSRRRREDLGVLWAKPHYADDLAVALAMRDVGSPVSVLRFDLDHFKKVNDSGGHEQGDKVLVRFMEIIQEMARTVPGADAYRVGGDEMTAILPAIGHLRAVELATQGCKTVADELMKFGTQPPPTTSIGVATFKNTITAAEADAQADRLAYDAKSAGRNRICDEEFK